MNMQSEVLRIESELAQLNVSVAAFCRNAALSPTTWVRWKNGASGAARASVWLKVEAELQRLRGLPPRSEAA